MKEVKIYGSGCSACHKLKTLVEDVIKQNKIVAKVQYSDDFIEMGQLGILSVPTIVIDGEIKLSGAIPGRDEIVRLLA